MIMYERLRRVYVSLREEERACQVLAAVGVHALCRSFDMSVEKKQGISNLELLYQEISRAEKAKEHKREQKKLKKKKKKNEKKNSHRMCDRNNDANSERADDDDHHEQEDVNTEDDEELYDNVMPTNDAPEDCDGSIKVVKGIVKERDGKRKALTAGQKDIEEDAGVVCDNLEEIQVDVGEEEQQSSTYQQKNQQQQKMRKQKQKQKLKTPQKKNNVSFANSNNKKKDKLKTKSSVDVEEVCKTIASINTTTTTTTTVNTVSVKCNDCCSPQSDCPCESDIKDSGYGSEPLSHGNSRTSSVVSSPEDTSEGSEVSCLDGFCNHENSGEIGLMTDLDDDNHHHYDDKYDLNHHSNYDQSFEFRFGLDSCNFIHQHQMNTLSLQQMLVSYFYLHRFYFL